MSPSGICYILVIKKKRVAKATIFEKKGILKFNLWSFISHYYYCYHY